MKVKTDLMGEHMCDLMMKINEPRSYDQISGVNTCVI